MGQFSKFLLWTLVTWLYLTNVDGFPSRALPNTKLKRSVHDGVANTVTPEPVSTDDMREFSDQLKNLQMMVNSTLDITCRKIDSVNLPGEVDCQSNAEDVGKTLQCVSKLENDTDSVMLRSSVEAINDHVTLLQTISERLEVDCTGALEQDSDRYLQCRQSSIMVQLRRLRLHFLHFASNIQQGTYVTEAPSATRAPVH